MTLSVHLLRRPDPASLARLRDSLEPEVRLTAGPDLPAPADYHILVAGRPQREHLAASPNLHTLIIPFAGLPETTRELLLAEFAHLAVHNLHYNAVPVAETALALMLAAAKFVVPMDRALRAHDWSPRYEPNPSLLLEGKSALILGYGAIGQRVAHLCRALGMTVMGIRRDAGTPSPEAPDEVYPPDALHSLLPQADVLFVCLPHTPETTGLVGEVELDLLPPSAVLVNVGRGPTVDESALYHALRQGRLHAAGLDVWYDYPVDEAARSHTPPSAYPFHELDNVVMSPHRAGHFDERERLRMRHLAALLNAAARGQAMPNRVDLAAGY
jgi:phosphoglycerate dehydrogenase-like enzyme